MKRMSFCLVFLLGCVVIGRTVSVAAQDECTAANTLIAFEGKNATGDSAIYTVSPDGSNLKRLTELTGENQTPEWSPSGDEIVYSQNFRLALMDTDGKITRSLQNNPTGVTSPRWSPDGSQIIVKNVRDDTLEIFNIEDGSTTVLVTGTIENPLHEADWSLDGNHILYRISGGTDEGSGLYIIDITQPDASPQIITHPSWDAQWTPDGSQILFFGFDTAGSPVLQLINPDGTNLQNVTPLPLPSSQYRTEYSFSPDGKQVVFIVSNFVDNEIRDDLFLKNLETGEVTQLTDTPDIQEANPDWQPCPGITAANAPQIMFNMSSDEQERVAVNPLTITETQLVDVPVTSELIVTLSEEWVVWRRTDYPNASAAFQAFQESQSSVGLTPATDPKGIEGFEFMSWYKIPEGGVASMTAILLPLKPLEDELGTEITAENIRAALNFTKLFDIELNGRSISVAINPQIPTQAGAMSVFPEQEFVGIIFQSAPADFRQQNQDLLALLLTSLRPEEEPLAIDEFTEFTGREFPLEIIMPSSSGSNATEGQTETTAETAIEGQTCDITAPQTVNLRSGPGTNYGVQGSLANGTTIQATGQKTGVDGRIWYRLDNGGWVRSDIVTAADNCDALPEVEP